MKIFIVVVVIAILAVGGYYIYKSSYSKPNQSTNSSSSSVSTNSINISNFSFDPASITVKAGSSITFTNNDGTNHTVTADNGKFDQSVSSGKTTAVTITEPGTYNYHCSIHSSMKGTIIVQ
ncbi:MAG: cupredoxin domain-containing protein [Patescibacteria group bacterium]|nr:cupredoxin domain-containing protein [Patescibacteria group bacterium]